jgi:YVTN family beta-propeller protein
MSWRLRVLLAASLVSVTCCVFVGFATYEHVGYYTGDAPRTYDCFSCHVEGKGRDPLDWISSPVYLSPLNLAVSRDGTRLYVTAQDADELLEVDLVEKRVSASINVGHRPFGIVLSPDGKQAFVSNEFSDTISVIDLLNRKVVGSIPTGNRPSGLVLTPDGKTLYVANWQGDTLSAIDLETGLVQVDLAGGGSPNNLAVAPGGRELLATNELSYVGSGRQAPRTEVALVDLQNQRTTRRLVLEDAHLLEGVTILPEGDLALVTLVKPKNLLPVIHVERGWTMSSGVGVIDLQSGRTFQFLLDEVNRYFADPFDIVASLDGRLAFVSHSGVDRISVIEIPKLRRLVAEVEAGELAEPELRLDLSAQFVAKRIPTASNPKGLAVSPDGRYLFVAERLSDSILAVDLETFEPAYRIDLGGPTHETAVRRGEKLFSSATRTFQGQFSCQSCHPRNHTDRLQYDFEPDGLGENVVDNRSLTGIRDTAPFKWNGKNTSLFMQCGIRFSRILTRVDSFNSDELSALVAYIRSLPVPPNPRLRLDAGSVPALERGRFFFERTHTKTGELIPESNRCITCHPPPLYTNRKSADVGSASPGDAGPVFDTPHLNNIFATAPYLHDGKARTLEEIWTVYNGYDTHGYTKDMSNKDLNDLIDYLKTF